MMVSEMVIEQKVYTELIKFCPTVPPETGGIIGGQNNIISMYKFDKLSDNSFYSSYEPNTAYLNGIISLWEENDIEFYGVFHSHFLGGDVLSEPDKEYIMRIMEAVTPIITKLYFPLIFPRNGIVPYMAVRKKSRVTIKRDTLIIAR